MSSLDYGYGIYTAHACTFNNTEADKLFYANSKSRYFHTVAIILFILKYGNEVLSFSGEGDLYKIPSVRMGMSFERRADAQRRVASGPETRCSCAPQPQGGGVYHADLG